MGNTKIINVQRGDSFEGIFNTLKNTDALEVILILPRGTEFSRNENYLESIKKETVNSGKIVSIMTSDPVVSRLATNYGLELLSKPQTVSKTKTKDPISDPDEAEDFDFEAPEDRIESKKLLINEDDEEEQFDDGIEATLASIRRPLRKEYSSNNTSGKIIKDIISEEPEKVMEIEGDDSDFEIDINKSTDNITDNNVTDKNDEIEEVWSRFDQNKNFALPSKKRYQINSIFKKSNHLILYIIAPILIIGAICCFFFLAGATVTVYPVKYDQEFQINVSASILESSVNKEKNIVPGQLFSSSAEDKGIYPSSGQKDLVQNAGGKILIYNKSFTSQRLVATTRFETPEGLIFRIPQTITVPAAIKSGTELTFGSVESQVYADRPGIEYNIAPTRFTVPGFKGTSKFDEFFALSTKTMSGGMIGPSKIVTEEDFSKAQEKLTNSVKSKLIQSLEEQSGDLKVLGNTVTKIENPIVNAKVGEAAENLEMTLKGTAQTVAFRENDIIDLIKEYLSKNGNLDYVPGEIQIDYLSPAVNLATKTMTMIVRAKIKAMSKIDIQKIKNDILGMSRDTVKTYFKESKEIQSVKIHMSPFWVNKIPKNPAKISIILSIH